MADLNLWTNRELSPKGVPYPESKFDNTPGQPFGWATPAETFGDTGDGYTGDGWGRFHPEPWRVTHVWMGNTR